MSSVQLNSEKEVLGLEQSNSIGIIKSQDSISMDNGRLSTNEVSGSSTDSNQTLTDDCVDESFDSDHDVNIDRLNGGSEQDDNTLIPISSRHTMTTRSKSSVVRPNLRYTLQISASSIVPSNVNVAKDIPKWNTTILDEMEALKRNHTWESVLHTTRQNVLACKWVYKLKQDI